MLSEIARKSDANPDILQGHTSIVELLLDNHAPFEEDKAHSAVLWTASYRGKAEIVDLLLRRFKASHSVKETAQFLLQRPHPKAGHPIMWAAASSGNADVIEVLLKHGAL